MLKKLSLNITIPLEFVRIWPGVNVLPNNMAFGNGKKLDGTLKHGKILKNSAVKPRDFSKFLTVSKIVFKTFTVWFAEKSMPLFLSPQYSVLFWLHVATHQLEDSLKFSKHGRILGGVMEENWTMRKIIYPWISYVISNNLEMFNS